MNKDLKFYWQLFLSTFSLSAFTFGGGFVIIPLMRRKFVDSLKWLDENEMLDLTAIAQSSPGAIAVNASILIGYRLAGLPGALVTVIGTVLPPLITLTLVSLFYTQFRDSLVVSRILRGMQAGVVAIVIDVVYTMGRDILRQKEIVPMLVMFLAFIAASFFQVNVVVIILACGLIGAATTFIQHHRSRPEQAK